MKDIHPSTQKAISSLLLIVVMIISSLLFGSYIFTQKSRNGVRAAGLKPITLTGTISKLPRCHTEFICYLIQGDNGETFLLSKKKFTSGFTIHNQSYETVDLSYFENQEIILNGFLVEDNPRYIVVSKIKINTKL